MQRAIRMKKVTVAIITKTGTGVETKLHEAVVQPMGKRATAEWLANNYGENAVILSVEDTEVMTYMSLETWLANCTTEPCND